MAVGVRSQPYRVDPSRTADPALQQEMQNIDEMLQILFEDLAAVDASVSATGSATSAATLVNSQIAFGFLETAEGEQGVMGPPGPPGRDGVSVQGPPGVNGEDGGDSAVWAFAGAAAATASAVDPQWSVLTNGDVTTPELIFADGDVIMLETFA